MKKIYFYKKKNYSYINNVGKINLVGIAEYVETDRKQMKTKIICSIYICLKLEIPLTQNRFKVIKFNKSKKEEERKKVKNKKVIIYLANIPVFFINNCFLFRNNVKYK